jgi:hypothetical protein
LQGTALPARIARYLMVWDFEFERDFPFIFVKLLNPLFQHSKRHLAANYKPKNAIFVIVFFVKAPKSIPTWCPKVIRSQFITK